MASIVVNDHMDCQRLIRLFIELLQKLAFLIDGKHDGLLRRIDIQPVDNPQLPRKLRIIRHLEAEEVLRYSGYRLKRKAPWNVTPHRCETRRGSRVRVEALVRQSGCKRGKRIPTSEPRCGRQPTLAQIGAPSAFLRKVLREGGR